MTSYNRHLRQRLRAILGLVIGLFLVTTSQADSTNVKNKTKGPVKSLSLYYPRPISVTASPDLLVVPLLGPGKELLPGGKLIVWVGHNDGTPLAYASIKVSVGDIEKENSLNSGGQRVGSVTLNTDSNGMAEFVFVAPNIPRANDGPTGPGGGTGGGTGGE